MIRGTAMILVGNVWRESWLVKLALWSNVKRGSLNPMVVVEVVCGIFGALPRCGCFGTKALLPSTLGSKNRP